MEVTWFVARRRLWELKKEHPHWTKVRLAEELGYSYSWVKKWVSRLEGVEGEDESKFRSRSRRPKTSPRKTDLEVVRKVLSIRDDPPEELKRIPGPVAILYYLHRDEELKETGLHIPSSSSTIWRILDEGNRIERKEKKEHSPLSRAKPMEVWQIDFKDVTTVPPQEEGKQAHIVETLDIVDTGTSILVDNQARTDYNAQTVIESLFETFKQQGCPEQITLDRDPRFVGSWSSGHFPSPVMRAIMCVGIKLNVCPPHRPDKNAFVERLHRTYEYEAIQVYRPHTFEQVLEMNRTFAQHYNYQRPNQALTCANQPPCLAFPNLGPLRQLPEMVDPDSWLVSINGQFFKRRVDAAGTVQVGKQRYYIDRGLRGHLVHLQMMASQRQFNVFLDVMAIKTIPLKGLHGGGPIPLADFIALMKKEALSQRRYCQQAKRRYLPVAV